MALPGREQAWSVHSKQKKHLSLEQKQVLLIALIYCRRKTMTLGSMKFYFLVMLSVNLNEFKNWCTATTGSVSRQPARQPVWPSHGKSWTFLKLNCIVFSHYVESHPGVHYIYQIFPFSECAVFALLSQVVVHWPLAKRAYKFQWYSAASCIKQHMTCL